MDDESETEKEEYPLTPTKMSKTPSWVMLGFILGALSVWMMLREKEAVPPPVLTRVSAPPQPARVALTTLTTIEAVFEAWGQYAVWDGDVTEVALDAGSGSFSEFYEVRRIGDALLYRSISKLTRRLITDRRQVPGSPLLFTESDEQHRNWLEHGRTDRLVDPKSESPVVAENPARPTMNVVNPLSKTPPPALPPLGKPAMGPLPKN